MKKKFFLITQVFYPDEVSSAGLFTNLCEELIEKGIEVEVWCAQPSYNTKQKQPPKYNYKGINICYLHSSRFNKKSFLGRSINYFTFTTSLMIKLLSSKSKTPIFTSTNPPYLGFIVTLFSNAKKRKVNYIIQDIFPDGLVRLNRLSGNHPVTIIWNKINRFILKRSARIIIIGRDMFDWINKTFDKALNKTIYIPIWQDDKLLHPTKINSNKIISENNLKNKFIVQYSGNIGLWNDVETIGKAINLCNGEDVTFLFIGDGIKKKELLALINDNRNHQLKFLPFQPKANLNISLNACHISLVSLDQNLEGIAVPSKIMGILATGKPCIAIVPKRSEIASIVLEEKCGIVIEPGNYSELVNSINLLKHDIQLREEMGQNARKAFLKRYTTSIVAEQYIELID